MLSLPRPKKSLRAYLDQYAAEHRTLGNRLTHMVGIPMIVASLPTMVVAPPVGGAMFVGGWTLQFLGHYVFEKNNPAFFYDPYYLLVGPVWVTIEWAELLGIPVPEALRMRREIEATMAAANDTTRGAHDPATNGVAHGVGAAPATV